MSQGHLLHRRAVSRMSAGAVLARLARRLGPAPPPPRRYFSKYAQLLTGQQQRPRLPREVTRF